ncbi:unnamed protein product [Orchesella dallaii]|uniref:Uncharacterized protein n=1 Tax=Orchesella dallaii TaxID=48710 RepID=A0ABP1PTZ3_9HEXA
MPNKQTLVADAKEIVKRLKCDDKIMSEFFVVKLREVTEIFEELALICDKEPFKSCDEKFPADATTRGLFAFLKEYGDFQQKLKKYMIIVKEITDVMCKYRQIDDNADWATLERKDILELRKLLQKDQRIANFRDSTSGEKLKKEFEDRNFIGRGAPLTRFRKTLTYLHHSALPTPPSSLTTAQAGVLCTVSSSSVFPNSPANYSFIPYGPKVDSFTQYRSKGVTITIPVGLTKGQRVTTIIGRWVVVTMDDPQSYLIIQLSITTYLARRDIATPIHHHLRDIGKFKNTLLVNTSSSNFPMKLI